MHLLLSIALSASALISSGQKSMDFDPVKKEAPASYVACKRTTWAVTDKCKDPAVANKSAPKDLKNEIERLAALIASSTEEVKKEISDWNLKEIGDYAKRVQEANRFRKELRLCYQKLGLNYDTYKGLIPDKCFELWTKSLSPSRNPYPGGPMRKKWAQAWLDLTTLAKTFPQHIQPSVLPNLLNTYDSAKKCVADNSCYPR